MELSYELAETFVKVLQKCMSMATTSRCLDVDKSSGVSGGNLLLGEDDLTQDYNASASSQ